VDEPAIREGLPLKTERWQAYLDWATAAFRLATGIAGPSVQIVTHLCYSSFEDIMAAIDALDGRLMCVLCVVALLENEELEAGRFGQP
jgi:5-methyltetrahydropteroyltriglutamate--homocysteine methyltransferase